MRRRDLIHGNAERGARDNHLVHAVTELMDVIRDLCRYAALFRLAGRASWAETLIEQCADLLAHRARLLDASLGESRMPRPTFGKPPTPNRRGTKWTN